MGAVGAESLLENREVHLSRQAIIGKRTPLTVRLIDRQAALGLDELRQETIFEDVHFVYVLVMPHSGGFVAEVIDLEHGAPRKLALDTEAPVRDIRRPDVRVYQADRKSAGEDAKGL